MAKSIPNIVRNGLEKEGAKSENSVVEPDLLTTNLGPKYGQIGSEYGPERFQKGGCKIRKFCCGAYIAHAQLGPKRCPNLVETYPNMVELPPCSCMVGGGSPGEGTQDDSTLHTWGGGVRTPMQEILTNLNKKQPLTMAGKWHGVGTTLITLTRISRE